MTGSNLENMAKALNLLLSGEIGTLASSYYLQLLRPGQIEPGLFIYWQDNFQEVVAAKWEQGSCTSENKTSIAFKNNPIIFDVPSHLTIIQLKKL